jgi:hypothetical protein
MHAHRLGGVLQSRFGSEQLGHASLHIAAIAAVVQLGGAVHQQARCLGARRHVG